MKRLFVSFLLLVSGLFAQQQYFQQEAHYTINVTLNAEKKTYAGSELIRYVNHSPDALPFVRMHLYPNAYKDEHTPFARQKEKQGSSRFYFSDKKERGYLNLTSLQSAGKDLNWSFKKDAIDEIKIDLPQALQPGDTLLLNMKFEGKFPIVFSRMGYFRKNHFAATQWYPKMVVYDRKGWHPDSYLNQGEFYGEYGSFDVKITLPKDFVIDATGILQSNAQEEAFNRALIDTTLYYLKLKSTEDKTKFVKRWIKSKEEVKYDSVKTVHFLAENVHNFAWFAGPQYMLLRKHHNDGVLTNVLVLPEHAEGWRNVPQYVEKTVAFYGKEVGAYQYPKASVVDGDMSAGGGMEYPMITIISMSSVKGTNILEMVVMHEVGHNWFMGMLGSDERACTFLDEGMNSFLEYKYMEHFYGFNNFTNFKKLTKGWDLFHDFGEWWLINLVYGTALSTRTDQPLNLRAEEYAGMNYGAVNYQKGVALLLALEWYLGKETFSKAMHSYFERWNGKHPGFDDFVQIFSDVSGKDLQWFMDEWFRSTHYNDFTIAETKTVAGQEGFRSEVFIENKGNMKKMPAPVCLLTETGDTLCRRWNADPQKPVVFEHKSPAKRIEVNLKHRIIESNYLNNKNGLPDFEVNFIPQLPVYRKYQINFLPKLWYDSYNDKLRLGAMFWSGNPIIKHWFARGGFTYGTATGKLHYSAALTNRFHLPLANYTDITAEYGDNDGLRRFSFSLSSFFKKRNAEDDRTTIDMGLDMTDLYDMQYNSAKYFETARYSSLFLSIKRSARSMLSKWQAALAMEKGLQIAGQKRDYAKINLEAFYRYKMTRSSYFRVRGYAGRVWGSGAPLQENIFSAGDADAKHKRFAFSRRGVFAPLHGWGYMQGMNMFGYNQSANPFFKGRAGASIGLDLKIKYLPVFYVNGAALAENEKDLLKRERFFAEGGLKLEALPVYLVIPAYVSDPPAGQKHLDFRFFVGLQLTSIRLGFQ